MEFEPTQDSKTEGDPLDDYIEVSNANETDFEKLELEKNNFDYDYDPEDPDEEDAPENVFVNDNDEDIIEITVPLFNQTVRRSSGMQIYDISNDDNDNDWLKIDEDDN